MRIKSVGCKFGSLSMAFILGLSLSSASAVAQDKNLDGKLVQYVRDAKKSGQKQDQVQQKAVKAGWPAAAVSDAVAYVYGTGTSNPALASNAAPVNAPPAVSPAVTKGAKPSPEKSAATGPAIGPAVDSGGKTAAAAPVHLPYEYRIGAGDVLQVSVWKEPEASANNVVVRPDGMISTPLIKEIQVAGLTPKQAETLITEKLVKVIQEPDVTVVVTGMASKKIYAVGAVKKEGPIPYTYSMTVMQAIAEAGGLTDYAKRNKIYVLRNDNGKESRFAFMYDEVLKGKHIEMNILLLPGDTLVVPH
jgi:polysaccharide biosynthesis/export protein